MANRGPGACGPTDDVQQSRALVFAKKVLRHVYHSESDGDDECRSEPPEDSTPRILCDKSLQDRLTITTPVAVPQNKAENLKNKREDGSIEQSQSPEESDSSSFDEEDGPNNTGRRRRRGRKRKHGIPASEVALTSEDQPSHPTNTLRGKASTSTSPKLTKNQKRKLKKKRRKEKETRSDPKQTFTYDPSTDNLGES